MIVFPNAKINIGLNITEKRSDGFHNIETVFLPIGLSDILEINISDIIGFSNLCYKAYAALSNKYKLNPVKIHLHKIIPFGAGLGGGSADASFTLKALNSLMELHINDKTLINDAEKIGSDCPFFILNKPAFGTEKGNNLTSIELSLKGYFLVLVHPEIHVNTAKAYSKIKPTKPSESLLKLIFQPIENWKNKIKNDFEESVFEEYPEIRNIKNKLYNSGAIYASMSGSGSAVYGIFKNEVDIKSEFKNYFVYTELL